MSNEGELTLEDFMIHFGSVLSQNFGELRGMLVTQAVKLQKLENMIKDLKKRQEGYVETPEEQVVPEEQFAKDLKQENKHPATSTPKRGSVDADLDEEEVSPYEIHCYDCKQSFIRGDGKFTRHVKETPCRPYKCHCGKLFKKKSSLNTHKTTHSTEIFTCHCGCIFKCEQYLKNHQRRKHGDEASAPVVPPPAKRQCLSPSPFVEDDMNEVNVKTEPLGNVAQEETPFDPMDILKMQMSAEVEA